MSLNKFLILFMLATMLLPGRAEALFGISSRAAQKEMIKQVQDAYNKGEYRMVEDIGQEFLLKNPAASKQRLKTVYLLLGETYKAQGQYDKALLIYNEAVEFLPKDEDINISLGGIYLIGGLTDNAKEIYRKVLGINKANKQALMGLAQAHYQDGFFSRSSMLFKEYADSGADIDSSFLYFYAMAQYMSNHSDSALELAFQSLAKDEKADTLFLISKIYKSYADNKNAFKYINRALEKDPSRTDIYSTKALWLAFAPETAQEGGQMADIILARDSRDKLALFIKYLSIRQSGKMEQSKEYLKKIKDMEGDQFIDKMAEKIYSSMQ